MSCWPEDWNDILISNILLHRLKRTLARRHWEWNSAFNIEDFALGIVRFWSSPHTGMCCFFFLGSMCRPYSKVSVLIVFVFGYSRCFSTFARPWLAATCQQTRRHFRRWSKVEELTKAKIRFSDVGEDETRPGYDSTLRKVEMHFWTFFLDEHQLHPGRNWLHSRPSRPCQVGFCNNMIMFFLLPSTSVLVTLCLMSMKPCARSENPSHEPASNPAKACESRGVFHSGNAKHFSDCHGSGCKLSLEDVGGELSDKDLTNTWCSWMERILHGWIYRSHLAVAVPKRKECHYVQQNWILSILHDMRRDFPASTGLCLSGF